MPEIIAGKYEVLEVIGRGGMGTVYKALQRNLDRVVAIKMLSEELAADPEFRARFQQEATIIARLNHPNIVAVHDIEPHNHTFCIIMEYLEGETLQAKIDRDVALSERDALSIGAQVARALHYAHEHGIVHRDIKPDNIHISPDGVVKVMDFGIARFLQSKMKTQTGISMGTPKFMSPEQVTGKNVDGQTDVYSLGICLYVALTGRVPFDGENAIAVATRHLYEPPEPPSRINPSITPAAEKIVLKALEKAKGDRFRDGAEMAASIDASLAIRTPLRLGGDGQESYAGVTQKVHSLPPTGKAAHGAGASPSPSPSPSPDVAVAVTTPTGIHRLSDAAAREHQRARETVRASTVSTSTTPSLDEEDFPISDFEGDEDPAGRSQLPRLVRRFWPLAVAFLLILAAVAYLLMGSQNPNLPLAVPGVSGNEPQIVDLQRLKGTTERLEQEGKITEALGKWAAYKKKYAESSDEPGRREIEQQIDRLESRLPLSEKRQLAQRRQNKGLEFANRDEPRDALTYAYLQASKELNSGIPTGVAENALRWAQQNLAAAENRRGNAATALQQARSAKNSSQREASLLEAVSAEPDNLQAWIALGDFYREQGYWDDARVAYQYARTIAPTAETQRQVENLQRQLEDQATARPA